jgi:hypothetical protein
MKSSLSIEGFKDKLIELTNIGEPILNGTPLAVFTPFKSLKSIFFGKFDDKSFRLTSNRFTKLTPYVIEGRFEQVGTETKVNYKISPIWIGYVWIRILPFIGIFYLNFNNLNEMNWFEILIMYIPFNLFLLAMMIILIFNTNNKKIEMEETFIKNFHIK